jgi:hypothetical protein
MEAIALEYEVFMVGLGTSIWPDSCFTLTTPISRFCPFPMFYVYHHPPPPFFFFWGFAFFLVAGLCYGECSVRLFIGISADGWLHTGRGTPDLCFSVRPCASESLNFSEPMFLLFGCDQYVTLALCIGTLSSLCNNFKYHFCFSKYSCSVWSVGSAPNVLTL